MAEDVLDEAARFGREGVAAALATVVRTQGSTPRHPGARMLIMGRGIVGTIGGGRIEAEVVETGRTVLAGGTAARLLRHLGRDLAMCCGGSMDLWIEPLAPVATVLAEAVRRREARRPCALVSDLTDGGKRLVEEHACLARGKPVLEGDEFVEPVLAAPRLILFGAGHVARAVAPLARSVGFEIVVCDDDDAYASVERFPDATLLPTFDPAELVLGAADHVLVVTRDHAVDQAIVERLAERATPAWVGVIGSRAKAERFRKRLAHKGLSLPFQSPVGLDIGAETPEEIAVSIVGELIRVRRVPA
jgi:xanthine dehydrogenase accessory factor